MNHIASRSLPVFALLVAAVLGVATPARLLAQTGGLKTDWLIDPAPYRAVVATNANELIMENGLARRVIQLAPNAATVDLQNLTTGEHLLRAIAPEARINLDGVEYEIGGLLGQPVKNYLKAEWLGHLVPNPQAYRLAGWTVGPTEARFPWLKRREWLSRDLPWPPPGRHVVLRFVPPPAPPQALVAPVLKEEDLSNQTSLPPAWKVKAARGFDRASFVNEGKAGEIMAGQMMAVCAEHAWPAGAQSVEVLMDSGDDRSTAWGPGLALVTGADVVRFITRPGEGNYEAAGKIGGDFDRAKPCRLRVRFENGVAMFEAAQQDKPFTKIGTVSFPNPPTALRVGKVGLNGTGADVGADRTPVRLHILKVKWRGAERPAAAVVRADLPKVDVHYEIYDGIPLFSKWLVVRNTAGKPVRVNRFTAEELRFVEPENSTSVPPTHEHPNLYVETDFTFGSNMSPYYDNPAVQVGPDPDYPTQVNYPQKTPCLLKCEPPQLGPDVEVASGAQFESFRAFVLLLDSTERERRTLAQRRMYRTVAPWTAQNPLMFHKLGSDPKTIRDAIAQAQEVGFEMVIMSFGSGFNFESTDPAYITQYRELAEEARARGIVLGGYSLLASRSADTPTDNTQGQPAKFGVMPCLGADWGQEYLANLREFISTAGLGVLEHDGSYPGDRCAAEKHPGHRGLEDSQWVMWRAITDFYKWCTGHGVYLNIPDWYFLAGGTKCGMHYRESNWSLPRQEQELIERQNMFDGTWNKTASMGWMFVPLSEYHGGGAAATIEPLDQHRDHYEARFANLLGYGVQACYRGPRLYDTDATKALVQKWVSFYKTHRQVLDGDIIHLRRASGRDWDGILHVNPAGKEKGLVMLYNPLAVEIRQTVAIPLYYTGLDTQATIRSESGTTSELKLDRNYQVDLPVRIPPHGHVWYVFE